MIVCQGCECLSYLILTTLPENGCFNSILQRRKGRTEKEIKDPTACRKWSQNLHSVYFRALTRGLIAWIIVSFPLVCVPLMHFMYVFHSSAAACKVGSILCSFSRLGSWGWWKLNSLPEVRALITCLGPLMPSLSHFLKPKPGHVVPSFTEI